MSRPRTLGEPTLPALVASVGDAHDHLGAIPLPDGTLVRLDLTRCRIRSWQAGDEPALSCHADSPRIYRNVRDHFPHPYTLADAEAWVRDSSAAVPQTSFAIEIDGEPGGGIGVILQEDVNRCSAEIGYWLGEAFWGRGIVTEAVRAFTPWAWDAYGIGRLYAKVFAWNTASSRVLEKAGYSLEGRLRRAAIKQGEVVDELLYAAVRES